jgi:antitoxin YefM
MKAVKQKGIVNQAGKIEIQSPELEEGTEVEVIILISSSDDMDETDYLLSTETNRKELLEAIERVEKQENLVKFTAEEFAEIVSHHLTKRSKCFNHCEPSNIS